jgi:ankyrin repeat protein
MSRWSDVENAASQTAYDVDTAPVIGLATVSHGAPQHNAAGNGKVADAQLLLDHGANTHARRKTLWTTIHDASWGGYPDVMRLLLEHGVDAE